MKLYPKNPYLRTAAKKGAKHLMMSSYESMDALTQLALLVAFVAGAALLAAHLRRRQLRKERKEKAKELQFAAALSALLLAAGLAAVLLRYQHNARRDEQVSVATSPPPTIPLSQVFLLPKTAEARRLFLPRLLLPLAVGAAVLCAFLHAYCRPDPFGFSPRSRGRRTARLRQSAAAQGLPRSYNRWEDQGPHG